MHADVKSTKLNKFQSHEIITIFIAQYEIEQFLKQHFFPFRTFSAINLMLRAHVHVCNSTIFLYTYCSQSQKSVHNNITGIGGAEETNECQLKSISDIHPLLLVWFSNKERKLQEAHHLSQTILVNH